MARFKPKNGRSRQNRPHAEAQFQALFNLAFDAHNRGELDLAERSYRQALGHRPQHADSLQLLGVLCQQTGRLKEAAEWIDRAIRQKPDIAPYHFNLAVILQELNRKERAADHYRRATALKPDYAEAHDNLGVVLHDLGDYPGALAAHREALKLQPGSILAHCNMGTLLNRLKAHGEALQHFEAAVELHPAHPEARMKLAVSQLHHEQFIEGWSNYSWRRHTSNFRDQNPEPHIPLPTWDGHPQPGRRILVYPEQGLGDEVMFASCFHDTAARCSQLIVVCDPRLLNLWQRSFPAIRFLSADELNKPESLHALLELADLKVPLGELPRHVRSDRQSFGSAPAYMLADPAAITTRRREYASLSGGLNVGISWRGGRDERTRRARSLPLEHLKPLLAVEGINLINLQYGNCDDDLAFVEQEGHHLYTPVGHDPIRDVDGFAATVAALDLVVSVDNSTIHFAGASGVPTLALLPCPPDWRWFGCKEKTPWYASLELLHQASADDEEWGHLMTRVAQRVVAWATKPDTRVTVQPPHELVEDKSKLIAEHAPQPRPQQRILLLNDTSHWYHWGCSCTSLAIHQQLRQRGALVDSISAAETADLVSLPGTPDQFDSNPSWSQFKARNSELTERIEAADTIVINGEGTMHGSHRAAVGLLYLARVASTRLAKPVQIINHSCYPTQEATPAAAQLEELYCRVYRELDYVAIREPVSAMYLENLGLNPERSFDCLPLFCTEQEVTPQEKTDTIVLAGSVAWNLEQLNALPAILDLADKEGLRIKLLVGASDRIAADDIAFVQALQQRAPNRFELVNATSESAWLDTISRARLLVSGRFHHSIAAAWLGTPFLVSGSNTDKISGLMSDLQLDLHQPVTNRIEVACLIARAKELLLNPERALLQESTRQHLHNLSLANFNKLAKIS